MYECVLVAVAVECWGGRREGGERRRKERGSRGGGSRKGVFLIDMVLINSFKMHV